MLNFLCIKIFYDIQIRRRCQWINIKIKSFIKLIDIFTMRKFKTFL